MEVTNIQPAGWGANQLKDKPYGVVPASECSSYLK